MLTSLITFICYVPLKSKILTHPIRLLFLISSYLSAAPHAVPHAAGFSSDLSPAPHAVPHAALTFFSSFHSAIFDNASELPPVNFISNVFALIE